MVTKKVKQLTNGVLLLNLAEFKQLLRNLKLKVCSNESNSVIRWRKDNTTRYYNCLVKSVFY